MWWVIACRPVAVPAAEPPPELVLQVAVAPSEVAVGYGNVYPCRVDEVQRGAVDASELRLVVLAGDPRDAWFTNGGSFVLEFDRHGTGEPYPLMPLTGFVDDARTSWTLRSARRAATDRR
ncbi:MAG: hypothetical protein ABMA64_00850 [Myxococcota bacterium]